jgi:hypothetical protein
MKTEAETEVMIILNNGFWCPLPLLNRVKEEMLFNAPGVTAGALFTTAQLCREEFYAALSDYEKSLAGSCMIHLAERDEVPFENVPRTGRNPYSLQYRIKASYTSNW